MSRGPNLELVMPEPRIANEEQIERQLAEFEENPGAPVDSTIRQLHTELETLAKSLQELVSADPHEKESGCRRAVEQAKALAFEMTTLNLEAACQALQAACQAVEGAPLPEYLEHFRILELLGQGGMGAVYLAQDTRLGRRVALKTLRPELAAKPQAKERFLREARLAAAVENDHIVPIYHVGEDAGIPYLAMPMLQGQSLEDLLSQRRILAVPEVLSLGIQIAEGLAAAHERGLIHRDIKPSNIWIEPTGGGRVKILDFGLARSSDADTSLTQAGAILGTPSYMAPEQARGDKLDARADLYSLGVVLYRAATGRLPLQGTDTMSMLMALATETPRPAHELNPEVPPPLSDLIMRLLAKDRDQRPASARAVIEELQGLQQNLLPLEATLATGSLTLGAQSESPATFEAIFAPQTLFESRQTEAQPRRSGRNQHRWPLVAVGLFFVLTSAGLLLLGQIILRITDKEGKTREIELKPGDRIEIVHKPTRLKTPLKELPEVKIVAGDPDRRTAEYVLSVGGAITIAENGVERYIRAIGDLPRDAFALTGVRLPPDSKVTDTGLAHFKGCRNLVTLDLRNTPVTDAGLAHFQDCKNLEVLDLWGTQTSDIGLAHFKHCKNLTYLALSGPGVTDAGLAHFQNCKNLQSLYLDGTQVTDAGLAYFQDCKNLSYLGLHATRISDAGLAHLRDCKNLVFLNLRYTRVTDAGLAHFQDCKNLEVLDLLGTQTSDVGLAHFKHCKNLRYLHLQGTRISDAGLAHLKDCRNLVTLDLRNTPVTDAGLAHFKDCKNLDVLDLLGTQTSDIGLAHFKHCKNLTYLALSGPGVTDAGLAYLQNCKNLQSLYLDGTQVTDAGLAYLRDCKNLRYLGLERTRISDAGLAHLQHCKDLTLLRLDGTQVTDESLAWIGSQLSLGELKLGDTRISLLGYEQLKAALPKCQIEWSEPNRVAAERVLALGGTVEIGLPGQAETRRVQAAADLPRELFQVRRVSLSGVTTPLGDLPDILSRLRFEKSDRLQSLDLSGHKGLRYDFLASIAGLEELTLANAGLNDAELARLPKLPTLKKLVLDGNEIRGTGLAQLRDWPTLEELSLRCPTLVDLFAKNLAELKQVKRLSLASSRLTDVGIKHLEALTQLEALDLRQTPVTAVGIARLQKALPKCKIDWDGPKPH
jgi:serine/threonine protein kinase